HVFDAATGLVYAQQRYYDDDIGRFLSADPVTPYGSPVGQFNRYRYGSNNPYRFTDPDGRRDWDSLGSHFSNFTSPGTGFRVGPPSIRAGDNMPRNKRVPDMKRVTLPGLGNSFLDSGFADRVDTWKQDAARQGVKIKFNSAFRAQDRQDSLRGDPSAITPARLSLHSAGFAVDVNYSSLRNIPGGLTGDQQRTILRDAATKAGLSWGGNFRTPDPPHFFRDPGGDRSKLIDEASRQVELLQAGGN
ncbi:hypothetical protein FKV24_019060, partial [Lysobacter maris]